MCSVVVGDGVVNKTLCGGGVLACMLQVLGAGVNGEELVLT